MDITNCNLLKNIDFVENIEFSENIMAKKEMKEEEKFDQEVWKTSSFDVKPKLEQLEASERDEVKIENDPSKEIISFVKNVEFSDIIPKIEIKEEKGFDQQVRKSSSFDVKPKLEQLEASERNEVKIENDPSKEIISFVENIEFSDIIPKKEIKEETGFNQDFWKSSPFDIKQKLEQVEASETGQAKIKYDPFKETIDFAKNIEFSDHDEIKKEIKKEEVMDQEVRKSSSFDIKPKLEASEVKIKNYPFKEIVSFVENIQFSESIEFKTEIKEEEGMDQEVWKSQPSEQKEASETSQVEIGTEPEEFFSVDDTETLCTESFVSDNVAVDEKKNKNVLCVNASLV